MDIPTKFYSLKSLAKKWRMEVSDILSIAASGELDISVIFEDYLLEGIFPPWKTWNFRELSQALTDPAHRGVSRDERRKDLERLTKIVREKKILSSKIHATPRTVILMSTDVMRFIGVRPVKITAVRCKNQYGEMGIFTPLSREDEKHPQFYQEDLLIWGNEVKRFETDTMKHTPNDLQTQDRRLVTNDKTIKQAPHHDENSKPKREALRSKLLKMLCRTILHQKGLNISSKDAWDHIPEAIKTYHCVSIEDGYVSSEIHMFKAIADLQLVDPISKSKIGEPVKYGTFENNISNMKKVIESEG